MECALRTTLLRRIIIHVASANSPVQLRYSRSVMVKPMPMRLVVSS